MKHIVTFADGQEMEVDADDAIHAAKRAVRRRKRDQGKPERVLSARLTRDDQQS